MMDESAAWETSKENVLPLKRGRVTKGLAERVEYNHLGSEISVENESVKDTFEKALSTIKNNGGNGLELLMTYIKYLKWTRDSFPSNKDKALQLLERCTFELKEDDKLKNDPQFVKVWIEYADLVRTPGEIFSFMSTNKIGEKVALFWIAWAFVAEKANNFKLTDQIFQKGIRRFDVNAFHYILAEPKDLLQKRYQQFQRRLARHYLNSDQSEEGTAIQRNVSEPESVKERKALSALTSSQTSSSRARSSSNTVAAANTSSVATNASIRQSKNATASVPFKIFSSSDSNESGGSGAATVGSWKKLGSENERNRENSGPVTKWNEAPLLVPPSVLPMQQPAAMASFIPIFVDESFTQNTASSKSIASTTEESSFGGRRPGLKIRDQLDKPMASGSITTADSDGNEPIEIIAKNPLYRHTQQQQQQHMSEDRKDPAAIPPSSSSINTTATVPPKKIISEPIVLPTTSKSDRQKDPQMENPVVSSGLGFSIFSDAPVSSIQPTASKDTAKLPAEKRSKPSSKLEGQPKIVPQGSKVESQSQSLGFTIFSDSQPLADTKRKGGEEKQPKEKKRPLLASSSAGSASTSGDIKADFSVPSRPFGPVDVSTTAQDLLSQSIGNIAEYDAEDSTINTKLARHDIDSMFCSPSGVDPAHKPSSNYLTVSSNSQSHFVKASIQDHGHHQHKQLPLGMKVEELTGIKDISAIKETSHDSSVLNGSHFMSTPSLQPSRSKTLSANMCQSEYGGEFRSERGREELGDEERKGFSTLSLYTSSHSSTSMDSDGYNGVDDDVLIPKRRKMLISSVSPSFSAAVLASIFSPEPLPLSNTAPQSAQCQVAVVEAPEPLNSGLCSSETMCVDDAVAADAFKVKDGELLGVDHMDCTVIADGSATHKPDCPDMSSDFKTSSASVQIAEDSLCDIVINSNTALGQQSAGSVLLYDDGLDEGMCMTNFTPFLSTLCQPQSCTVMDCSAATDCCANENRTIASEEEHIHSEQPPLPPTVKGTVIVDSGTAKADFFDEQIDFCSEDMFALWTYNDSIAALDKETHMHKYGRVKISCVSDCPSSASATRRRTAGYRRSSPKQIANNISQDFMDEPIDCIEESYRHHRCTETVTDKECAEPRSLTLSPTMEMVCDHEHQMNTVILDVAAFERNKYIYSWDHMMEFLHENYSNTRGGATSIWDLSNSSIPDALMKRKQVCSNRSKNITLTQIPGPNISVVVLACVGVGSFGRAVLAKVKASNSEKSISRDSLKHWGEYKVLKVDRDQKSVIWEIYIQAMIHMRTEIAAVCGKEEFHDSMWQRYYQQHFFPFDYLFLYENSAVVSMPFGDMGTLFSALKVIHSSMSANQHEFIVAFIVTQMLHVLMLLTKIGIIHCDIKLDNWVLKRNECPNNAWEIFRVVMIDFGKAKATTTSHHLCDGDNLSLEYSSTISADLDEIYKNYVSSFISTETSALRESATISGDSHGGISEVRYYNYFGSESAKCSAYEEQCKSKPWSHQLDYFGVAKCAHQLLFMAPLSPLLETIDRATSRGYQALPLPADIDTHIASRAHYETSPTESVFVPSTTIKRYWNGPLWGSFFHSLLNGRPDSQDGACRVRELNLLSEMFATYTTSTFSESMKQAATNTICEKLLKLGK